MSKRRVVLMAAVAWLAACGEPTNVMIPTEPPRLWLPVDSVTLLAGQTYKPELIAITPGPARTVFRSSAWDIAYVDSTGLIQALRPGRAVMRVHLADAPYARDSLVVIVSADSAYGRSLSAWLWAITDTADGWLDRMATPLLGTTVVHFDVTVAAPDTAVAQVVVDGMPVCSILAPPEPVHTLTCRIDTEELVGGHRRFAPGEHWIGASVSVVSAPLPGRPVGASMAWRVTFGP